MSVPVLTYHALSKERVGNKYVFHRRLFYDHLEFLSANKYNCILVEDYYKSLVDSSFSLPPKTVVITFDDGHDSDFEIALAALRKYHFKANFFVTTDWIGKPGYMKQNQIVELKKQGMSIQSHARTHSFLDEMGTEEIYHELRDSKKILQEIIGEKVSFVSLPGGRYDKNVLDCAKRLNYFGVFSSNPYSVKKVDGIYLIGRTMVKEVGNGNDFAKLVMPNIARKTQAKLVYRVKDILKRTLGSHFYYFLWGKYNRK